MYAIIETGGKQYRVSPSEFIEVELLQCPVGESTQFERILFLNDGQETHVGTPIVSGATVSAEHVQIVKGEKLLNFKFKRRKNQRRKKGHRQHYSKVRIVEIMSPKSGEKVTDGT